MPSPVSREAVSTASRMISSAGISPPSLGAYEVGSTWISSQREPSFRSSSAASRTRRRMSSADLMHERAASYRRWKRNQPRSSVARSRGGSPARQGVGQRLGESHPVLVGQFQQGAGPHGPGEVQMQMGLRQLRDITYTLHSPILPYVTAVPVALSPYVVLLAQTNGGAQDSPGRPGAERKGRQSRASASSFWIRLTPSTRSSSPSA